MYTTRESRRICRQAKPSWKRERERERKEERKKVTAAYKQCMLFLEIKHQRQIQEQLVHLPGDDARDGVPSPHPTATGTALAQETILTPPRMSIPSDAVLPFSKAQIRSGKEKQS
jgi:hypothetical protein